MNKVQVKVKRALELGGRQLQPGDTALMFPRNAAALAGIGYVTIIGPSPEVRAKAEAEQSAFMALRTVGHPYRGYHRIFADAELRG